MNAAYALSQGRYSGPSISAQAAAAGAAAKRTILATTKRLRGKDAEEESMV